MIEKMKLKVQPKFTEFKYIVVIHKGPLRPRKGMKTPVSALLHYADTKPEVAGYKKLLVPGEKMLVFKGNFDFIEGYICE